MNAGMCRKLKITSGSSGEKQRVDRQLDGCNSDVSGVARNFKRGGGKNCISHQKSLVSWQHLIFFFAKRQSYGGAWHNAPLITFLSNVIP